MPGGTKICKECRASRGGEEEIGGLDIAVDYALFVQVRQGGEEVVKDAPCHILWYRAGSDEFRERERHIREDEDKATVLVMES